MIKQLFIACLMIVSAANAEQLTMKKFDFDAILKRLELEFSNRGKSYLYEKRYTKDYIGRKLDFLDIQEKSLVKSKTPSALQIRKALAEKRSRFEAYTKALETCLVVTPVSNETVQMSSAGIQSQWCLDMKKSLAADMVRDLATSKGISQAALESDQDLVAELIQELRDDKKIASVEVSNLPTTKPKHLSFTTDEFHANR